MLSTMSSSKVTPLHVSSAIERYLQFLQSEENKSSLTISNYRQSLALLQELMSVTKVTDIDKDVIRDYK